MPNYDFLLEMRLKELNNDLAHRYKCCTSLFEQMLKRFLAVFPNFTDHTLLHTLNVVNISNQLLQDQVELLNAEEIYVYLMSCALHDIGMGVSDKDLELFIDKVGIRSFVNHHPEMSKPALIRKYHNEFSATFVKKYWQVLEIPNDRYAEAIAEVGRGHRKTDLMDEALYPANYDLGNGKHINLAFLTALIRIADELDIASDRNPDLLYNREGWEGMSEKDLFEFSKHQAIHAVAYDEDTITVFADTDRPEIYQGIIDAAAIVKDTLDYCVSVMKSRSEICICCDKIKLVLNLKEVEL